MIQVEFSYSYLPNKKESQKIQVAVERTKHKGVRFMDYIDDIDYYLDESVELLKRFIIDTIENGPQENS